MVPVPSDQSPEFLGWKRDPGRSVAAAVVGLVLAWILGGALVLGMLSVRSGTASVSEREFWLWMSAPLAVGCAACASRRARYWAGAVLPGAVAGWLLGLMTFLGLALVAAL